MNWMSELKRMEELQQIKDENEEKSMLEIEQERAAKVSNALDKVFKKCFMKSLTC